MNKTALKAGYWASVLAIGAFVAYIICYAAILLVNPLFIWTDFANYLTAVQTTNQIFKNLAMVFMIFYGACFVIQLCSIEEIAEGPKKYFARVGKLFALGFFTLISINYFVQISAVRMQIAVGRTNGLEQFVQANPISGMAAVNMLGWTIFFGLSSIFAALAFGTTKIERVIRIAFLANGIIMFTGAGGYLFNQTAVVFICLNLGMGAAVFLVTISLSKLFKRKTAALAETMTISPN